MRYWNAFEFLVTGMQVSYIPSLPMRYWNDIETSVLQELDIRIPSLPMRYWNETIRIGVINQYFIPSLPMRYWNHYGKVLWFFPSKFPAYLWGIEINWWTIILTGIGYIPSLPMRYWNNYIYTLIIYFELFPAYLWGIEIQNQKKRRNFYIDSQPTYEVLKCECQATS